MKRWWQGHGVVTSLQGQCGGGLSVPGGPDPAHAAPHPAHLLLASTCCALLGGIQPSRMPPTFQETHHWATLYTSRAFFLKAFWETIAHTVTIL